MSLDTHLLGPGRRDGGGWSRITWLAGLRWSPLGPGRRDGGGWSRITWLAGLRWSPLGPGRRDGGGWSTIGARRNCHPVEVGIQGPPVRSRCSTLLSSIRHGAVGERRPDQMAVPRVGSVSPHSMTAISETPRPVRTVGLQPPSADRRAAVTVGENQRPPVVR